MDSEPAETLRDNAQVLPGNVLDGNRTPGQCGHAYETAHLDHIRKNPVRCSMKRFLAIDSQEIGADAFDFSTHCDQHFAELLDIRLAGRIVDYGLAFSQTCRHQDIGSAGHGSLIQKHITAA